MLNPAQRRRRARMFGICFHRLPAPQRTLFGKVLLSPEYPCTLTIMLDKTMKRQGEAEREVMSSVPVLYVMEPIGVDGAMEAVDVLWFCSVECRGVIEANTAHVVTAGESNEYIGGTMCDKCGIDLLAFGGF